MNLAGAGNIDNLESDMNRNKLSPKSGGLWADRGPATWGKVEDWSLPNQLARRVASTPDSPFISFGDGPVFSFSDIDCRARRLASRLSKLGVSQQGRALLMVPNQVEFIDGWFALNLLGVSDINLNTAYRKAPLVHAVNLSEAETILLTASMLPRIIEVQHELVYLKRVIVLDDGEIPTEAFPDSLDILSPSDLPFEENVALPSVPHHAEASVIFTSGTTGPAKGVMMPQALGVAIAREAIDALRITAEDTCLCVHPLFHMGAKFGAVLATLIAGSRIVVDRRFEAQTWLERVRSAGATVSTAHGPMIEMIHAQPARSDDANNPLRALSCCPLPKAIAESFQSRFGLKGVEVWGMTEVSCASWMDLDEPLRVGSAGRPVPGLFDIRVVDPETDAEQPPGVVGEIVVRSLVPWVTFTGYMNMPEKTAQSWRNLWLHSGDAGYIDQEGYLYMVDRLGDRIRRRAENISSYDIETAALKLGSVTECAAVGVPSEFASDDDIKLYIVTDGEQMEWSSVFTHMVRHLPHYMVPRYYQRLDALPRTPATNKVQKAKLRVKQFGSGDTWDYRAAGLSIRNETGNQ